MKKTVYRFSFATGVVIAGILIILIFTFLGDKSKGPLSEFLSKIQSKVIDIESSYLLSQRKPVRSADLGWFNKYRVDKELLSSPDTILWGIYDNHYQESFENVIRLEDNLNIDNALIQLYIAWGDKPEQEFPMKYVKAINSLGSTPFITWEPWLNDFDRKKHGLSIKEDQNKNGLLDVINGDYDFYIEKWALDVKEFGKTVFIRLGHEMNDPYRYPWGPQNNKPQEFVDAWKHVVDRFNGLGATNVVWVWSPHQAYMMYEYYYPGDDYVDWVGVGALNYGTVAVWSKWWSFSEIFGDYYYWLQMYNKPLIITEFGSLAVGGEKDQWFFDALNKLPQKYPLLKAVMLYNNDNDNTTLNKTLDWSLNSDTLTWKAIHKAVDNWVIDK
ncbi:MAG: hypothetical protein GXO88_10870 [Chlorobi bacterium]|nr:hypothetical protein [Chlorobiota bacterium]